MTNVALMVVQYTPPHHTLFWSYRSRLKVDQWDQVYVLLCEVKRQYLLTCTNTVWIGLHASLYTDSTGQCSPSG